MPDTTAQHDTRPATVDLVLLAVTLAAVVTLRGSDVLAILIAVDDRPVWVAYLFGRAIGWFRR